MLETRRTRPCFPLTRSTKTLGKTGRHEIGRRRQGAVILHNHIRLHVEGRREAEEIIEAYLVGSRVEGFRIIGLFVAPQAEVPFADDRGAEVRLLEQRCQVQAAQFNEQRVVTKAYALLERASPT